MASTSGGMAVNTIAPDHDGQSKEAQRTLLQRLQDSCCNMVRETKANLHAIKDGVCEDATFRWVCRQRLGG